jgi:hypothetical protein
MATIEHDPEKWTPVSRLREAVARPNSWVDASAGEGRSEKIMLQNKVERDDDSKKSHPALPAIVTRSAECPHW